MSHFDLLILFLKDNPVLCKRVHPDPAASRRDATASFDALRLLRMSHRGCVSRRDAFGRRITIDHKIQFEMTLVSLQINKVE